MSESREATLLVASTGGHLKQLYRLRPVLPIDGPYVWVTFDTPQSRSLLAGEDVEFVPFVGGRDPANVLRNVGSARRIFSRHRIQTVVSTGSAVAIPYFALARGCRLRAVYIESAARTEGPSLSARIISRIPGVELYCQYPSWTDERWTYAGSVFDAFEATALPDARPAVSSVVVTLGTYEGFGFRRLLERLLAMLPTGWDVVWQTGDTDAGGLPIDARREMPAAELTAAMEHADVVIAHAGVGSALAALELGKAPVLVPRREHLGEHVDDHQIQVARELDRRGLAVVLDADDLELHHLEQAAGLRIETRDESASLALVSP